MTPPKSMGRALPEPPRQHSPWKPPATDLNLVSSLKVLFDLGLADPRGGEYRTFTTILGSDPASTITVNGWVFPSPHGQKPSFAVTWAGTVYPALYIGAKANLHRDVEALLRADELSRQQAATSPAGNVRWNFGAEDESHVLSETNMCAIKVALLMRLGEGKLARKYWQAWHALEIVNESKKDAKDPFYVLARFWTWTAFNRALHAHLRGDDALTLANCRTLAHAWPALEQEAARRGYTSPNDTVAPERSPCFEFLKLLPDLLADQERRRTAPHQPGLTTASEKSPANSQRIASLIADLEQVAERPFMNPGGIWLAGDSKVQALIAEGPRAVEPLLDCMEHDPRLTRAVDFRRFEIKPVRAAAQAALDEILQVHFDTVPQYRAYWQTHKLLPKPS